MTHAHCMLDKYGYKDTPRSLLFHSENGCTNVPKLHIQDNSLTLNPLTWKIWWAPNNANKWQMGFNSEFKGLSPSGISDLSGNSSRDGHAEGEHVNRERETLQDSVLPYSCSMCPRCCVCLGCCAADLGSSDGTYELLYLFLYCLAFFYLSN
jgi:hypothetical protein